MHNLESSCIILMHCKEKFINTCTYLTLIIVSGYIRRVLLEEISKPVINPDNYEVFKQKQTETQFMG
jgi:hypothetical protein